MSMGFFILFFVTIINGVVCQTNNGHSSQPPNVIIMLMDDMGFGDLGINGDPNRETPNLDLLAAEGALLTDFYSSAPLCSPSRASLLTGRLPIRNGFYSDNIDGRNSYTPQEIVGGIDDSEILLPELLSGAGYQSALIGKWHLGHRPQFLPTKHGFDTFFGSTNCHFGPYDDKNTPNIPIFQDDKMIGRYFEEFIIDRSQHTSNLTQIFTQKALDYISIAENSGRPFLLYWSPDSTHAPSYRSEKFIGRSKRQSPYGDALVELDDSVGRIVSAVKASSRLANNTLIFFTSDNGAALVSKTDAGSNAPFLCGKQTTFEGGFRMPSIAWWQGHIRPGTVFSKAASFVDLFATIAEMAGQPLPSDRVYDGTSFLSGLIWSAESYYDKPIYFYRGNRLMAIRFGLYKAHFWTWTNSWAQWRTGIDFCPFTDVTGITTHEVMNYTASPKLFHLGRDPSEKYIVPNGSKEYHKVIPLFMNLYEHHVQTMIPGKPVLNWCDKSVMHWAPPGCHEIGKCLPIPSSQPYKCDWPH